MLTAAMTLPMAAVPAMADDEVTLVYAEVNPEDSLMGRTAAAFKEKVEELTDGSVKIDIQYSGVLGDEATVLDTMIGGGGTIDLARVATFSLTNYGAKRTSLLSVPYTFSGREHFWKFADSELGAELLKEPEETGLGVQGLFYVEEGFRHFFLTEEVSGLEDLAGKKLRVSNDPIMTGMVDGLKASATVVAFGELYSALSSGVVDGAEQPIVNYQSNAFNEVAPYMIKDGHTLGCAEVLITDAAMAKLSEEQAAAVAEAGKYASEFNADLSEEIENECIAELEEAGVKFTEVEDLTEWQEACADIINSSIEGMEEDYQAILDMQ
ncbi:MAG: TRAP transporter substrate-binding protein [Eubacteriales bacterium]|nr:TRAP transporter substrate-binding protein [Eubacteriales bacterium]